MFIFLRSVKEEKPGEKWKQLFDKAWPYYRHWFLSDGYTARPTFLESRTKLRQYMPELEPIFNSLCELVGGGDLEARFLSHWSPPAYLSGCSQIAWNKDPNNYFLIRNYDYSPKLFEGVQLYTNWNKKVIGISDGLWGLLDGINEDGLVVSLTFGGRKIMGEGFGIPVIMRYVLEFCSNTKEAISALKRVPSHMAYNITLIDKKGISATVFVTPGVEARVYNYPIGTNHQEVVDWEDYAVLTETRERNLFLEDCLLNQTENKESLIKKFLSKPLFSQKFEKSFGTLYTSCYSSTRLEIEIIWKDKKIVQTFDNFTEQKSEVHLSKSKLPRIT
jgi:predicted choloylglycine hydrolase